MNDQCETNDEMHGVEDYKSSVTWACDIKTFYILVCCFDDYKSNSIVGSGTSSSLKIPSLAVCVEIRE